jgi:FeS assembly protein IscX
MPFDWDASYEIILELMAEYPDVDINSIGLEQLYQMIVSLPNFNGEPSMVNDDILESILGEWYEEVST